MLELKLHLGFQSEELSAQQVSVYDADTQEWRAYSTQGAVPSRRASVAMATGKDGIYMFGGKIIARYVIIFCLSPSHKACKL